MIWLSASFGSLILFRCALVCSAFQAKMLTSLVFQVFLQRFFRSVFLHGFYCFLRRQLYCKNANNTDPNIQELLQNICLFAFALPCVEKQYRIVNKNYELERMLTNKKCRWISFRSRCLLLLPRNFKEKQGHLILSHLHMELHGCANRSIEHTMCIYIYILFAHAFGSKRHIHIIYIYTVFTGMYM